MIEKSSIFYGLIYAFGSKFRESLIQRGLFGYQMELEPEPLGRNALKVNELAEVKNERRRIELDYDLL
jgi:hypothetical protein